MLLASCPITLALSLSTLADNWSFTVSPAASYVSSVLLIVAVLLVVPDAAVVVTLIDPKL